MVRTFPIGKPMDPLDSPANRGLLQGCMSAGRAAGNWSVVIGMKQVHLGSAKKKTPGAPGAVEPATLKMM